MDKAELVSALKSALDAVHTFASGLAIELDAIATSQGFERIAQIDQAVEATLTTGAPSSSLATRPGCLRPCCPTRPETSWPRWPSWCRTWPPMIRAETEPPDITAVMGDVESLLNDSIATEGYWIGPASKPEALVNLSEMNFEALQTKFAHGKNHTEAEKLKRLVEGKLNQIVKLNGTRMDLAERFRRAGCDSPATSRTKSAEGGRRANRRRASAVLS